MNDLRKDCNSPGLFDKASLASRPCPFAAYGCAISPCSADCPGERPGRGQRAINAMGITFTVYSNAGMIDHAWPPDILPRISDKPAGPCARRHATTPSRSICSPRCIDAMRVGGARSCACYRRGTLSARSIASTADARYCTPIGHLRHEIDSPIAAADPSGRTAHRIRKLASARIMLARPGAITRIRRPPTGGID